MFFNVFLFCLKEYSETLIVGICASGKTNNALLNVINHEPDIDKIYLYANDPYEAKYQLLISKRESTGWNYLNDSKAFIKYSNNVDDIYRNTEKYNPKNNKHVKKVGHTSELLFGIYWWTWKTLIQ